MSLTSYFRKSLSRKIARRVTKEYPARIDSYSLSVEGEIKFANWENPLIKPIPLTQEMIDFFKKFIHHGDLVIDIGANIGDTTVPMAIAAGKEGLTLAFEPGPLIYKILKENSLLNPDKQNIVPIQFAIAKDEQEYYYISSEASFSNGGLSTTPKSIHGKFIYPTKVKSINLNNYLNLNYSDRINKLSFIKVDTEGYDKEILKSISEIISTYKPVIVAESFGENTREEKEELFEVISQHGYDIYYFYDFDIATKIIKLNSKEDLANWQETVNIYAVPK